MTQSVLVCGGAGYIGSHMVRMLAEAGHNVTVFDNLSTGHKAAVQAGALVHGDLLDTDALEELFAANRFDAVFHFSGLIAVAESVREPARYYRNNVIGTLNLLEAMHAAGVGRFVFSSTAAVYGNPQSSPLDERQPLAPINPYGRTKRIIEDVLTDFAGVHDLRSVSFRYFNAAGAHPEGGIGEAHVPETPSDPQRPAGGPGHTARHRDLRRRLPDRRRDLRTRLRPCPGSVHGPSGGSRLDGGA